VHADVSSSEETVAKARVGKTGVELRFHTRNEYQNLTDEQKKELNDHRDSREAKGLSRNLPKAKGKQQGRSNYKSRDNNQRKPGNKKMKVMIAEAVASAVKTNTDKATVDASVDKEFQDYIVSLVEKATGAKKKVTISTPAQASSTSASVPTTPPAVTLNSILGRIKK
jgi:hypothetical protein